MSKRRAFTLIELLVVVAIIVLLIAILIPSLAKARKQARSATCLANERSLTQVWRLYIQENGAAVYLQVPGGTMLQSCAPWTVLVGTSPLQVTSTSGPGGTALCGSYKVATCPETSAPTDTSQILGSAHRQWMVGAVFTGSSYAQFSASYGFNDWLGPPLASTASLNEYHYGTSGLRESDAPVITDAVQHAIGPLETDPAPSDLENPRGTNLALICLDRHSFAVNVSFVDGHADTVKLPDLWMLKWHAKWTRSTPQHVGP